MSYLLVFARSYLNSATASNVVGLQGQGANTSVGVLHHAPIERKTTASSPEEDRQ